MKKNYSNLFENSSDFGNNMGRLFLKHPVLKRFFTLLGFECVCNQQALVGKYYQYRNWLCIAITPGCFIQYAFLV